MFKAVTHLKKLKGLLTHCLFNLCTYQFKGLRFYVNKCISEIDTNNLNTYEDKQISGYQES
jgi:hypothetical protein